MPLTRNQSWYKFVVESLRPGDIQKATRIPASVITRYRSGQFTPSPQSLKKLQSVYRKWVRDTLDDVGAHPKHIRKMQQRTPQKVLQTRNRYVDAAIYLSTEAWAGSTGPKPLIDVIEIMQSYDYTPDRWRDSYPRARPRAA